MDDKNENANSQISEKDFDIDFDTITDVEEIKTKAKEAIVKAKDLVGTNRQVFARAKKAEGFELQDGKWIKTQKQTEQKSSEHQNQSDKTVVTQDDLYLSRTSVHEDDFETVKKFATLEGVSVKEALKSEDLKAVLNRRVEVRKSAEVTNTGTSRRTTTKVDDSTLLDDLSKGKVPAKGSDEAERLFWAKRGGKK